MKLETSIRIAGILSDAQEEFFVGRLDSGRGLLNEAKRALFQEAYKDAESPLSFEEWLETQNAFISTGQEPEN